MKNIREQLDQMTVGDIIKVSYWEVTKVVGGWIYHALNVAVFVPERIKH